MLLKTDEPFGTRILGGIFAGIADSEARYANALFNSVAPSHGTTINSQSAIQSRCSYSPIFISPIPLCSTYNKLF
jgi:hypothetical protein